MAEPETPETPETEPETPEEQPNDTPAPAPQEDPEPATVSAVEPRLAFDEFVATAPGMATLSRSVQEASQAALRRWMRTQGKNADGHYVLAEWQACYTGMLAHAARI